MPDIPPPPLTERKPALTARYRVLLTPADARQPRPAPMEWLFLRDDRQVRHVKGLVEQVWTREPGGALRCERLQRGPLAHAAVDRYPAAELAGPPDDSPCWHTLTSFIDAADISQLRADARVDSGIERAAGQHGYTLAAQGLVDLLWDSTRQLPLRMTRVRPTQTLSYTLLSAEPSR